MLDEEGGRPNAFAEFEQRHALFSHRVDGWSPWRVVRNPLRRAFISLPVSAPSRNSIGRILEGVGATFSMLTFLARRKERDLIVKTCRSALRVKHGEKFRDVYFDGLLESGYSFVKIEEVNASGFDQQARLAWKPAELNSVFFTAWGRVLGALLPIKAVDFCDMVSRSLGKELGYSVGPDWIRQRLSTVYWQRRLYRVVLNRVRPRAVLLSDTGEYGLIAACRDAGVPVIEYQHGVFDANHPDSIPDAASGSDDELLLPDLLACRGLIWRDALQGTKQGAIARSVGNEIIDQARQRISAGRSGSAHIVVSSQGLDTDRLEDWLGMMIRSSPPDIAWKMTIKLHPIYDDSNSGFRRLVSDKRVSVIEGSASPSIFDLLADADVHLSISSACHFDACALGVASIIIPLAGHEIVERYADGVALSVAESPDDVWRILHAHQGVPDSSYYSEPNFVANMRNLIENDLKSRGG